MDEIQGNPMYEMLNMIEALDPLVAGAKGIKAKLEEEGFSSRVAEDVAREFLVGCMRKTFSS